MAGAEEDGGKSASLASAPACHLVRGSLPSQPDSGPEEQKKPHSIRQFTGRGCASMMLTLNMCIVALTIHGEPAPASRISLGSIGGPPRPLACRYHLRNRPSRVLSISASIALDSSTERAGRTGFSFACRTMAEPHRDDSTWPAKKSTA